MAYLKLALDALDALGDAGAPTITKWIKSERPEVAFKPHLLKAALKKAVEKGDLLQTKATYSKPGGEPAREREEAASASAEEAKKMARGRCAYKVEYAKSGQATCRGSWTKIAKGEIRLAPSKYKTGNDGDERTDFYKLDALFDLVFRKFPDDFWLSSESQIAGFEGLSEPDQAIVKGHIESLIAEREGTVPPAVPYEAPCWERRALEALEANDKAAFERALTEEGATAATTKVTEPRLGGHGGEYLPTDVKIHHCGDGPTDNCFSEEAQSCGLFYTLDGKQIWGAAQYQGDEHHAFGEEMLVGYAVNGKALDYSCGDSLVDIARKNGRSALVEGVAALEPLLAAAAGSAADGGADA